MSETPAEGAAVEGPMSDEPADRAAEDASASDLPPHPLLQVIAAAEDVPRDAIMACMLCIPEVAPGLLAAIARAGDAPVTSQSELNLVYYGVYILAAAREPRLQAPLLRLLLLPDEELAEALGEDYVTMVPQIAMGAFDGDAQALFDLLSDTRASPFVRMPLAGAVAHLTWLGLIAPETTRAFLHRFDTDRPIPEADLGWNGWETIIEILGWQDLAPLVEAAYADGRLDTGVSELSIFREGLAEAVEAAPDDGSRFEAEGYGYIDDVLEAIAEPAPLLGEPRYPLGGDDPDDELGDDPDAELGQVIEHEPIEDLPYWAPSAQETRRNPMRHVGRNDPCPCGSGKKYKRCCLAA